MSGATALTPEQLLERFGLSSFRHGQREAVQAALEGRDCLVVMPTGAGKSLCYQLPALAGDGLVLVVSPLIALMDDQRAKLLAAGVRTAMVASNASAERNAAELQAIATGQAQIALVAPERFSSRAFRQALLQRTVSLFVVDEAHCVAEWGHDFRPDYLRLGEAIASVGRPPVMASTATATPTVAKEIATRLALRDWVSVAGGFDRPNIAFDVLTLEGEGTLARKRAAVDHLLASPAALPAIVYCGTRRDTESVAEHIQASGIEAVAYHAGMDAERRRACQERFMAGEAEVIVATNAFGMGVDKADVRTVVHWAIPTSLEGFYQEAGRAGRDGRQARAALLAARVDLGRLIRFNVERDLEVAEVRRFVGGLRSEAVGDRMRLFRSSLDDRRRLLLSIAERAGAVVLEPAGGDALVVQLTGRGSPRAAHLAIKAAKDRGWEAYKAIERFVGNGEACRRRQILRHFGDASLGAATGRCCDVCDPDPALARALADVNRRSTSRRSSAARRSTPARLIESTDEPIDSDRFERLRAWRAQRAEGKPAYTVASNATLEEILRRRPRNHQELLAISGIGPAFCARHGDSLLSELVGMSPSDALA